MRLFHLVPHRFERRRDDQVGQIGEGLAGARGRDRTGKQPHANEKLLLLGDDAQPVERFLVGARARERGGEPFLKIGPRRQFRHQSGIEHAVEDMRPPGDQIGELRCRRHHGDQEGQEPRIVADQREELDAGREPLEEFVEAHDRLVGAPGGAEHLEKARGQFGQLLAGLGRTGGAVAAIVPGADDAGDVRRSLEAETGERFERARIVVLAGKDEIAGVAREALLLLEEAGIDGFDRLQPPGQRRAEGFHVGLAGHQRHAAQFLVILGQRMGLLVAHHLDAVLDVAEVPVGGRQLPGRLRIDPVGVGEPEQRLVGPTAPKRGHATTGDQLLGLNEELDLADAAAPELDVVALDRDLAETAMAVDLALDRMNVGDRGVIEIFAEDEGGHIGDEASACLKIAGHRTRLDIGRSLPVLAATLVIVHRRINRERERRRAGIGPEPQVCAEDVTVGGAFLHYADQSAHQPGKGIGGFLRVDHDSRLGLEEDDDIDVGGEVEFPCPVLAHAEHDDAGRF